MSQGRGRDTQRHAACLRIQGDTYLIGMEVRSESQQYPASQKPVGMQVLRVGSLLKARIVLLDSVAVHRVVQVEREVGIQVKQGTAHEPIHLEAVTGLERLPV